MNADDQDGDRGHLLQTQHLEAFAGTQNLFLSAA
jgi:hypothetical protein